MTRQIAYAFHFRWFVGTTQRALSAGVLGVLAVSLGSAAVAPRTVMFLGDSVTFGYGVERSQAFPALVQEKINARGWNFKVINAGQSGDTSAGGLSRLEWLLRSHVDVLVLELGGNDGLRGLPVEVTKKNLQAIIDRTKARYPEVKIVLAGMKVPPNMGQSYSRQFEAMFTSLAKKNNAKLIPFVLEGVGGVRELNLPDGIHPTVKGHRVVAANVWKALEPLLRSLDVQAKPAKSSAAPALGASEVR
jgi:acyl-CoA thioesterase-1